jgi:protein TonB
MVRTQQLPAHSRPEPARVLAIAAAIAVHVLAFLLLLLPLANSPFNIVPAEVQPERRQIQIEIEPPPLPPAPVVPRTLPTPPQTAIPRRVAEAPVVDRAVVLDQGALPAQDPAPVIEAGPTGFFDATPLTGAQLAYATAPAPVYPREAARIGAQGTVLLMVLVDTDGTPLDVTLHRSSGNRYLDRAATEQVLKRWRFQPAMRDGRAVQAYGVVPIAFTMQ